MEEAALRYEYRIDADGFTCCTWMSNLLPRRAGVFVAVCVLGGSAACSRGGGRECLELIHADDPFRGRGRCHRAAPEAVRRKLPGV